MPQVKKLYICPQCSETLTSSTLFAHHAMIHLRGQVQMADQLRVLTERVGEMSDRIEALSAIHRRG